jgi:serine/threonine protein kinase
MTEPGERLLNLAKAVSDGEEVDWSRVEADAQDEEERELLTLLQEIGQVAELHRTQRREGPPAALSPVSLESWGQLQIRQRIGEGASAEVFRARDPRLDRDVALKLFRHGQWMSPEQRRMVLQEGKNLARLRHENIVAVHGADEHEGRVGIWMDLVEGRTLSEVVRTQGVHSAGEATQIGIELCRALAAVHRKNLVHADIKGQNVKREEGGRIVLMDFSSSRGADDSPGNPESDPTGTPLYMAPELWEKNSPTVESDIYALGVLLYHLVTGEFPVRAPSVELLREAHKNRERHLLRDERPGLPNAFVRTVEKALSANPLERFRSAGALEEALHAQQELVPAKEAQLPLEVRVIARVARFAIWLGSIFLILMALGFITSTSLNVVLGRPSAYAPESLLDWFVWGARSLLGPTYHAVVTVVPSLGLVFVARLAYRFEVVRRRFAGVARWADDATSHIGLMHAAVLGALALGALIWWYYNLIDAIYSVADRRVDEATLALLSPANEPYHLAYRRHFTLLVIALALATVVLRGVLKAKRRAPRLGPALAMGVVIACATVLMEFPWRILWQADFPRVQYAGERCYEVGAKEDDLLLFCPLSSQSTTRIIERGDELLVPTGVIESVFRLPSKESESDRP